MKHYTELVSETLAAITEEFPWDIEEKMDNSEQQLLILDIREPNEFTAMHIEKSLQVPLGVLEAACEYNYE